MFLEKVIFMALNPMSQISKSLRFPRKFEANFMTVFLCFQRILYMLAEFHLRLRQMGEYLLKYSWPTEIIRGA
jgi:hypothetical protein